MRFYFFLRIFNTLGEDAGFDRRVIIDLKQFHRRPYAVAAEDAHQLVVEAHIEARGAAVTLTACTAAQLVVNAPRLMPLGTDDVQAAKVRHSLAQFYVDASARHIRGDGDLAAQARIFDYLCFFLVIFGIENIVLYPALGEQPREPLRLFNRTGSHQHRTTSLVHLDDLVDHRPELAVFVLVDDVVEITAAYGLIRGNRKHVQSVDVAELALFGLGRAGHPRQLFVQAEIILKRDGRKRLVFALDLDAFFGLDGLMDAVGIAASVHEASGELVDDDDLAVFDDVLFVKTE